MRDRRPTRPVPADSAADSEPGRPWVYRIVVAGRLDADWSERLAGLRISVGSGDRQDEHTVLEGPIRDRAELYGVLTTLGDQRFVLLSLEVVEGGG